MTKQKENGQRIMKRKKSALLLAAGALLMGSSFGVQAFAPDCTKKPHVSIVLTPSKVEVNPTSFDNAQVGGVIATMSFPWAEYDFGCTISGAYETYTGVGAPIMILPSGTPGLSGHGDAYVYPTNLTGIGYSLSINLGDSDNINWAFPYIGDRGVDIMPVWPDTSNSRFYLTLNLIRTGPVIQGGALSLGTIGRLSVAANHGVNGVVADYILGAPIQVKPSAPTCTVTQSAITVNLPGVSHNELNTVGATAKDTRFTIPLTCKSARNLGLSIDGELVEQSKGVFKNTDAVTGDSIGIQILDKNNNPVVTGVGNFLQVGNVSGSTVNYPMTARYYTLAPNPPMGPVKSVVYATIVYN